MSAKHPEMSADILQKLEQPIASADLIQFGGVGEPLLANGALDRLRWIRATNPSATVETFTNGTPFLSRRFTQEAGSLLDAIHFSLDGISTYESVHVGNTFQNAVSALRNIRDVRRECDGRPRLYIEFILMRRNVQDIVPVAGLAAQFGALQVNYKAMWVLTPDLLEESFWRDARLAMQIRGEIATAREYGIPIGCSVWPELSTVEQPAAIPSSCPCQDPWCKAHVVVDGQVSFCCMGQTWIGDLNRESFEQIWNGKEASRYRKGLQSGEYYKDCQVCPQVRPADPVAYEKYNRPAPSK